MKVQHSGTHTSASEVLRLDPRLCLLFSSLVVVPAGLVLAAAGPAGAVTSRHSTFAATGKARPLRSTPRRL